MTKNWKSVDVPSNLKDIKLNHEFICLEECKNYDLVDGKLLIKEGTEVLF